MRGAWILLASLALASAEKCNQHKTKSTCDDLDFCLWSEHSSSCVYTKETDDDPTADVEATYDDTYHCSDKTTETDCNEDSCNCCKWDDHYQNCYDDGDTDDFEDDKTDPNAYYAWACSTSDWAGGDYTWACGANTTAEGKSTLATGIDSKSEGHSSMASGVGAYASAATALAVGDNVWATAAYSSAFNYHTEASWIWAVGMGYETKAASEKAFTTGYSTIAHSHNTFCGGYNSFTSAYAGLAMGYSATTKYNYSSAVGYRAETDRMNQLALGKMRVAENCPCPNPTPSPTPAPGSSSDKKHAAHSRAGVHARELNVLADTRGARLAEASTADAAVSGAALSERVVRALNVVAGGKPSLRPPSAAAASELGAAVAAKSHRYATTSRPRERAVAFSVAADAGAPSADGDACRVLARMPDGVPHELAAGATVSLQFGGDFAASAAKGAPTAPTLLVRATVASTASEGEFEAAWRADGGSGACARINSGADDLLVVGQVVDDIHEMELESVVASVAGAANALLDERDDLLAKQADLRARIAKTRAQLARAATEIARRR